MSNNKYLIIIPAFNEEENVGEVLKKVKEEANKISADIFVINDGSFDRTAELAEEEEVQIINLLTNQGNGAAVQTGFRIAVKRGYDFVVIIDADGQHDAGNLVELVDYAEKNCCDMVIGSRYLGKGLWKYPCLREIGVKFFSWLVSKVIKTKITDCTSGFRVIRHKVFSYFAKGANYPQQYPDADFIIAVGKLGFSIKEYQVLMHKRKQGLSMHRGIIRPLTYTLKMLVSVLCAVTSKRNDSRM